MMNSVNRLHTTEELTVTWTQKLSVISLTLWRPPLLYGMDTAINYMVPGRVTFWHPGTLTLRAERQSARMSKITNDSLTRSGTGCFIAVSIWQQWASTSTVKWLNLFAHLTRAVDSAFYPMRDGKISVSFWVE